MKILITGGSGYLGTKFVEALIGSGYQVLSFDAEYFSDCSLVELPKNPELRVFADSISIEDLRDVDVVIHFAGISNDPLKQLTESELYDPAVGFTMRLANICRTLGIRFFFASSCSIYGFQSTPADEKSRVNPQTPYSNNKLEIENELLKIATHDWSPLLLRFATVYGFSQRMRFDTVINMLCGSSIVDNKVTLNSNGAALRPFIFIQDAIKCVKWLIESNAEKVLRQMKVDPILNVGSNSGNYSINAVAEIISRLQGNVPIERVYSESQSMHELTRDRKIQDGADKRSYFVDFQKLHTLSKGKIEFTPFEVGIKDTLDNLKAIPLQRDDFYSPKYYRLQYLEKLIDERILDSRLRYLK